MGKIDEHWCNSCKRLLNKKNDKYIEFELVNIKPKKGRQKAKGIICQICIDKSPQLKKSLELFIKAGNPNFEAQVKCLNRMQCENHEPQNPFVDCKHIAVIEDKIYCKRSHPGQLKLVQEKAELERYERKALLKFFERYIKDPQIKKYMDTFLLQKNIKDTVHIHPTTVVPSASS